MRLRNGSWLYAGDEEGLKAIDLADPRAPVLAGTILPDYGWGDGPLAFDILGDRLFVATSDGVHEFDVSDPGAPVPTGYLRLGTDGCHVSGLALANDLIYVGGGSMWVVGFGEAE